MHLIKLVLVSLSMISALSACTNSPLPASPEQAQEPPTWLAGDHHIHSQYSVGWNRETNPPTPEIGGDAIYPIYKNATKAREFGLSWMVTTDHGGPNHSKVHLDLAYPELLESRKQVTEVIQFYGMELDTPAGEHSSLIIPHVHHEAQMLYELETRFDTIETFPVDESRNTEEKMIEALNVMKAMADPPVVIVNHPARTAKAGERHGAYHPAELRNWHDTAPNVAIGMAGAPGHQAITLTTHPNAADNPDRLVRGGYGGAPTMGGFDQMTARLGGFWDSMLAEGRRWWITANSDSHIHYTEKGVDFWPGEYSKTYVLANPNHESILAGLRGGRIFVTTGDLVSEAFVEVRQGRETASIGEQVLVRTNRDVEVTIRVRDPSGTNANGDSPTLVRVDLIAGHVTGKNADPASDHNATTSVVKRFYKDDWARDGEYLTMAHTMAFERSMYFRVRGTNTAELEPENDPPSENPWNDLWFYTNPVFVLAR